jgi:hypothetical protein
VREREDARCLEVADVNDPVLDVVEKRGLQSMKTRSVMPGPGLVRAARPQDGCGSSNARPVWAEGRYQRERAVPAIRRAGRQGRCRHRSAAEAPRPRRSPRSPRRRRAADRGARRRHPGRTGNAAPHAHSRCAAALTESCRHPLQQAMHPFRHPIKALDRLPYQVLRRTVGGPRGADQDRLSSEHLPLHLRQLGPRRPGNTALGISPGRSDRHLPRVTGRLEPALAAAAETQRISSSVNRTFTQFNRPPGIRVRSRATGRTTSDALWGSTLMPRHFALHRCRISASDPARTGDSQPSPDTSQDHSQLCPDTRRVRADGAVIMCSRAVGNVVPID